jgi:pilus assembly protein CpaB
MRTSIPATNSEISSVSSLLGRERLPAKSVSPKSFNLVPILIALVVILLLVAAARTFAPHAPVAKTVQIVGAGQDIFPGTRISFQDLHYVIVPDSYYSDDMFTKTNLLVGRVAKTYIGKGEPIVNANLFAGKDGIAQRIENHERAITLKLDDYALVDHSINSGDKVDVIVTSTLDGRKYSKTVCQSVPVLFSYPREALHSTSLRGQESSRITLAVTSQQAELLALAEESGKIKLVLRNRLSSELPHLIGYGESDLLPSKALEAKEHLKLAAEGRGLSIPQNGVNSNLMPPPPLSSGLLDIPSPSVSIPPSIDAALAPIGKTARWVVEVFSGSKRDLYEIPQSTQQ